MKHRPAPTALRRSPNSGGRPIDTLCPRARGLETWCSVGIALDDRGGNTMVDRHALSWGEGCSHHITFGLNKFSSKERGYQARIPKSPLCPGLPCKGVMPIEVYKVTNRGPNSPIRRTDGQNLCSVPGCLEQSHSLKVLWCHRINFLEGFLASCYHGAS